MSRPIESGRGDLQVNENQGAMSLRAQITRNGGLATKAGLARHWGITRSRVGQLAVMEGFPKPVPVDGGDMDVYVVAEADEWRRLRARKPADCPKCHGTGGIGYECRECNATGRVLA